MTDKRFTAALSFGSALAGAIAQNQTDPELAACRIIRNQPNDVIELAILYADVLLEKLAKREIKEPIKSECEHTVTVRGPGFKEICQQCEREVK